MTPLDVLADNANEIVFILCGMLGGVAHYLKKYVRKETTVPISEWFGNANVAATIYTILVFIFAMIGSIASGVVNSSMSVWISMYVGFVTGFALDAGFNNDGKGTITIADMERGVIPGKPTGMGSVGGFEPGGRSGYRRPMHEQEGDEPPEEDARPKVGRRPLTDLTPDR